MKLPWNCPVCYSVNMVEMDELEERPIDKIRTEIGYTCCGCKKFQKLFISTKSLEESMKKFQRFSVSQKEFYWHFGKAIKKALGVQKG